MTKIELMDGKYTVVNELEEGGGFRALRYGEEWRNLAGDNLVLVMTQEIEELREYIAELETAVFRLQDDLSGDGVLTLSEQVAHYKAVSGRLQERNNLANELLDEVEDELVDFYLAETEIYTKINEFLYGSDSDD